MKTCLVVEDSDIVREITARIAVDLGLEALEAQNAASGLDIARDKKPDLVFLDWDLPSMGALDFLRGAATLDRRPPIVLCATENDPQQFALAKAAGAAFHILKPYDRTVIAKVLDDVANTAAAPAEAPSAEAPDKVDEGETDIDAGIDVGDGAADSKVGAA